MSRRYAYKSRAGATHGPVRDLTDEQKREEQAEILEAVRSVRARILGGAFNTGHAFTREELATRLPNVHELEAANDPVFGANEHKAAA